MSVGVILPALNAARFLPDLIAEIRGGPACSPRAGGRRRQQ